MKRWFAVCCKPRQELVAQENLQRQGFRVYLPRIRVKRRRKGQWLDVIEVMFPRYIFIQVDPSETSIAPVRSTRGVAGMVRFGGQPAVIADEIMEALRLREDAESGVHQDNSPLFCKGEQVKLSAGPLAGLEGVFVEEDGEKRIVILLELLGQSNKIRVDRNLVEKAA